MLKWFIIGTLLYYAVLLWRYRDSLGTWFTGGKREPEQPESKPTVKAGNGDCLVGASRYRMGQMRTNGDILGHLSKEVDNASIFVPQSDETVIETPAAQAIDTEFEMEFETENTEETDVSADEIEAEEIACYMGDGEPEMAQGITLGGGANGSGHSDKTSVRNGRTASRSNHLPDGNKPVSFAGGAD